MALGVIASGWKTQMGRTHVVKQGERLATIAAMYGVSPTIIYADPDNAELWKKRPNPNQLLPGDEVSLGDPNRPSDLPTGAGHTLMIASGRDEMLSIFLGSRYDASFAGQRFELKAGKRTIQGKVPDDNVIVAVIALGTESGELKLWLSEDPEVIASWTLKVGHLDPITEVSGVQARLNNLGYGAGEVDGNEDDDLKGAVASFQNDVGLEPSGEVNDDCRAALDQAHDEQKFPPNEPEEPELEDATFDWEYSFVVDGDDDDEDGDDSDEEDDETKADGTTPAAQPVAASSGGLWGEIKHFLGLDSGSGASGEQSASSQQTLGESDEDESSETTTTEDDDDDDDDAIDNDGYVETGEEELADNDDGSSDNDASGDDDGEQESLT